MTKSEAQARVAQDLARAANGAVPADESSADLEAPQFSIVI